MKKIIFGLIGSTLELFLYFYSLVGFFKKSKRKVIIFSSINNLSYSQNSRYLFEFLLSRNHDFEIYFVVNDSSKIIALKEKYGNHFISSHSLYGVYLSAKANMWICSDLAQPYHRFFRGKKYVYHLGHGVPLKKIVLNSNNIGFFKKLNRILLSRSFTHILSYSDHFKSVMLDIFKNDSASYVTLGQPRYDAVLNTVSDADRQFFFDCFNVSSEAKFVLYAPTWRFYESTKVFPFSDLSVKELQSYLQENNIFIFLRVHPYMSDYSGDCFLECPNVLDFDSDRFFDVSNYLPIFDSLITDYSSIYFDFLLLDRPILFLPYDIEEYSEKVGFSVDFDSFTPGFKCLTKDEFFVALCSLSNNDFALDRKKLRDFLNIKNKGNCIENYHFIKGLLDHD